MAGGLSVPRERAEILDGDGNGVLAGTARVVARSGEDITVSFIKGAQHVLETATSKNIGIAIRGTGTAGGFWDIDNVRLIEYPCTPEFTDDSFVNLEDFSKMAAEWQSCTEPETDVTGDGCVNMEDLLILIEYWLSDG